MNGATLPCSTAVAQARRQEEEWATPGACWCEWPVRPENEQKVAKVMAVK